MEYPGNSEKTSCWEARYFRASDLGSTVLEDGTNHAVIWGRLAVSEVWWWHLLDSVFLLLSCSKLPLLPLDKYLVAACGCVPHNSEWHSVLMQFVPHKDPRASPCDTIAARTPCLSWYSVLVFSHILFTHCYTASLFLEWFLLSQLKDDSRDWRDGLIVKNNRCSCREPELGSQHACQA